MAEKSRAKKSDPQKQRSATLNRNQDDSQKGLRDYPTHNDRIYDAGKNTMNCITTRSSQDQIADSIENGGEQKVYVEKWLNRFKEQYLSRRAHC